MAVECFAFKFHLIADYYSATFQKNYNALLAFNIFVPVESTLFF